MFDRKINARKRKRTPSGLLFLSSLYVNCWLVLFSTSYLGFLFFLCFFFSRIRHRCILSDSVLFYWFTTSWRPIGHCLWGPCPRSESCSRPSHFPPLDSNLVLLYSFSPQLITYTQIEMNFFVGKLTFTTNRPRPSIHPFFWVVFHATGPRCPVLPHRSYGLNRLVFFPLWLVYRL